MFYLSYLRIDNLLKNLLILAPLITLNELYNEQNLFLFIKGFTSFSLLTLFCYLINDYSDKKIDKKNLLKKSFKLNKNQFYFFLIFLVSIFFLTSYFFETIKNIYLYVYLLNFLLYNFYFKKKKYIDLIFLNNFYLIRIMYGIVLFNIDIDVTIGFLLFFYFFFFGLSTSKRIIQVILNKLKLNNQIIPYSRKDILFLKFIIILFFTLSASLFMIYILNSYYFDFFSNNIFTRPQYSLSQTLLFFFTFVIWLVRCMYLILKNKINIDIYKFFFKDKFSYFSVFVYLILSILFIN